MVGIVLVSHSLALANAVLNLVRQVATSQIQIAVAAGMGGDHSEFGTNAVEISAAIQSVINPLGVLVLMDIGSAILSAEAALELLPDDIATRVRLCPAPFVEGAIAAAIQAGLGSDIDTVHEEAKSALRPKHEHLGPVSETTRHPEMAQVVGENKNASVTVAIHGEHGLHLRPAARFVQTASSFKSDIFVRHNAGDEPAVSGKSLSQLMSLGVSQGDVITITAKGSDSEDAVRALKSL
ncbi:MAG TPA: dihydroxyacetone kinase phosphoryl donor subunit DhaM, partial [Anaerolineae bacterium]